MAILTSRHSGKVTFTGLSTTDTITPSVDITKSILYATYTIDDDTTKAQAIMCVLTNGTTVTFSRNTATGSVTVSWYVVEFSSGVAVQRGVNTDISGTTQNQALSPNVGLTTSFAIVSNEAPGSSFGDDDFMTHQITTVSNLAFSEFLSPAGGFDKAWQVVDYDNCSVQRNVDALTGATLNKTITAVTNINKTVVNVAAKTSVADALMEPNLGSFSAKLTTTTNLEVTRIGTTLNMNMGWEVIEFTGGEIIAEGDEAFTTTETVRNVPLSPTVDLTKAVVFCSNYMTGGKSSYAVTDNYGTARVFAEITASNNLRLTRGLTGSSTLSVHWFIIQFDTGVVPSTFTPRMMSY